MCILFVFVCMYVCILLLLCSVSLYIIIYIWVCILLYVLYMYIIIYNIYVTYDHPTSKSDSTTRPMMLTMKRKRVESLGYHQN